MSPTKGFRDCGQGLVQVHVRAKAHVNSITVSPVSDRSNVLDQVIPMTLLLFCHMKTLRLMGKTTLGP